MLEFHDSRAGMSTVTTTISDEDYEFAQARAEDWLVKNGEFSREAVKEIMMMLAQPPRANVFSGRERRAV